MRIRAGVVSDVLAHAQEEAPNECCGLLVADDDLIVENVRTPNLESSPVRYRVDPAAHFRTIRALRGTTKRIAGAYHSHPHSRAAPSHTDIVEAFDPQLLYVIVGSGVSGDTREVRGFRIASGTVVEVPLVVVP